MSVERKYEEKYLRDFETLLQGYRSSAHYVPSRRDYITDSNPIITPTLTPLQEEVYSLLHNVQRQNHKERQAAQRRLLPHEMRTIIEKYNASL